MTRRRVAAGFAELPAVKNEQFVGVVVQHPMCEMSRRHLGFGRMGPPGLHHRSLSEIVPNTLGRCGFMQRFGAALLCLASVASGAAAADMPTKAPVAPAPVVQNTWNVQFASEARYYSWEGDRGSPPTSTPHRASGSQWYVPVALQVTGKPNDVVKAQFVVRSGWVRSSQSTAGPVGHGRDHHRHRDVGNTDLSRHQRRAAVRVDERQRADRASRCCRARRPTRAWIPTWSRSGASAKDGTSAPPPARASRSPSR